MKSKTWLIYGANGMIGALIAERAIQAGHIPILAGRNAVAVAQQAQRLDVPYRIFSLEDEKAIQTGLKEVDLVINCATNAAVHGKAFIQQAIAQGAHYLEVDSSVVGSEYLHHHHQEALRSGSVLMNGVGFESVAGDCLAALLRARLPDATQLRLAFDSDGIVLSAGLKQHQFHLLQNGGLIREDGRLLGVPLAYSIRDIKFGERTKTAVHLPMSELYTAYISTEIPNIQTYQVHSMAHIRGFQQLNWFKYVLNAEWFKKSMQWYSGRHAPRPDAATRQKYHSYVWGEVVNPRGARAAAYMRLPNIYDWTAQVAVRLVAHLLHQVAEGGYYTPSLLMGAGFIRHTEGINLVWEN